MLEHDLGLWGTCFRKVIFGMGICYKVELITVSVEERYRILEIVTRDEVFMLTSLTTITGVHLGIFGRW